MAFVNGVDSTGNVNITVFPNKYDLIKEFKKNGILDCDKDRYTRKRKHGSLGKISMIVIKIDL